VAALERRARLEQALLHDRAQERILRGLVQALVPATRAQVGAERVAGAEDEQLLAQARLVRQRRA
jgi:hypothetical protein